MATHDDVHAFTDGELPPAEAAGFRAHLAQCPRCQAELNDILQLAANSSPAPSAIEVPPPAKVRVLARRSTWVTVAGGAVAAALAVFILRGPASPTEGWTRTGQRALEPRLAWEGASSYLLFDTVRGSAKHEEVPMKVLAALEQRRDWQGLGAAILLAGDPARAKEAMLKAPPSAARDADLAAADLRLGELDEALDLLDGVLAFAPRHPQALWNRALALQALGLRAGAAEAFGAVARLREPGWSSEAAARAKALAEQEEALKARFQAAVDAGGALVIDGLARPPALVRAAPMVARTTFFLALWSRPSADEVRALAPLARELDALAADRRCQGWLDRIAARDFTRRAPLAADFRRLVRSYYDALGPQGGGPRLRQGSGPAPFTPEESAALVTRIQRSTETDLLLGALALTGRARSDIDLYEREAKASGDLFFLRHAALERARLAHLRGDAQGAEDIARQAVQGCANATADLRCLQLHQWLAQHYREQHRLVEAQEHAQAALELAQAQLQLTSVDETLLHLGDLARLRGSIGRTRAFLEERILRAPDDPYVAADARLALHESLAVLRIARFDPGGARAELQEAGRGGPLTRSGAYSLSDVIRQGGTAQDVAWLETVVAALRSGHGPDGHRAMMDHIEGRALIDTDPAAGAALLRKSIEAASRLPADGVAQKAFFFSFRDLRLDAGRRGAHDEVFRLLHEEGAAPESPTCALAIEIHDDRREIAARGASGAVTGRYETRREAPDARTLLPQDLKQALQGCQMVKVFASPPVHGQGGLLPDDVAWSYAGPASAAPPAPSSGEELVVHDVEAPASLHLPRLAAWADATRPGTTSLTGAEATPQRVMAELKDAGLVELHTHGLVDLGVSDASLLVLAPDSGGRYALTAQDIRKEKLAGHPVVLLAACRAARVAPFFHEPWSLPRAFTDAGARAVIAAPVDLPDDEARQFFRGVMDRLRSGESAPLALRDERVRWLAEGRGDWVRQVLVFE